MYKIVRTAFAFVVGLNIGAFTANTVDASSETPIKTKSTNRPSLETVAEDRMSAKLPTSSLRARLEPTKKTISPVARSIDLSKDWIDAQPTAEGDAQWACLSEALYFEARGENVKGQFAVAEVILNRVSSARFPSSVCAVINQGTGKKNQCQFSYTCDGRKEIITEKRAYERVSKVARLALDGDAPEVTEGATHYHTTAVSPRWSRVYKRTTRIGTHIFYRHTWRTASN